MLCIRLKQHQCAHPANPTARLHPLDLSSNKATNNFITKL